MWSFTHIPYALDRELWSFAHCFNLGKFQKTITEKNLYPFRNCLVLRAKPAKFRHLFTNNYAKKTTVF